ncbi:MAG: hypothetical protein IPG50_17520 [Myxococcales bacterium]|nr:hypothetical protein [Myxococcales bacterium]
MAEPPLVAFRDAQWPALRALTEGLVGAEATSPATVQRTVVNVDAHVAAAAPLTRLGLVLLVDVLRVLPLFVVGTFALVESLSAEERARFLEKTERSPRWSLLIVAIKTLVIITFYELPGELERIGYRSSRLRYLALGAKAAPPAPSRKEGSP